MTESATITPAPRPAPAPASPRRRARPLALLALSALFAATAASAKPPMPKGGTPAASTAPAAIPAPSRTAVPTAGTDADLDAATAAAVNEHERLGLALFRADRTAWLTTDLLFSHGIARDDRFVGVDGEPDGWVTSPTADPAIWRVAYVAKVDGEAVSVADGTVDFSGAEPMASLRRNEPLRPLDADEKLQRAMRADALARDWMVCSRSPYNAATVPDGHGGWYVYLSPPQTRAGEFPMGGFHRFAYDGDGGFVAQYAHTRGCIDGGDAPGGDEVESLMVTHLTTPTPNEFHAFMSLAYGLPVFVSTTDRRFWVVVGGDINYLSDLPEAGE